MSSTKPYWPLLVPLLFRSLSLLLPQTYFQPDEFYQALEPAHWLVFGYGHLTWEWRDLPLPTSSGDTASLWWEMYRDVVVGGRMRGWLWPGVFAGVYKLLQVIGREDWIAIAPRLIGVLIASLTDLGTYKLGIKLLGPGAGSTALLLSLTSIFNAYALPRALSTSPETLLTVWALVFFPLPPPNAPARVIVGDDRGLGRVASKSMQDLGRAAVDGTENVKGSNESKRVVLGDAAELDYTMMDLMHPFVGPREPRPTENIAVSAALAMTALCIRPTTLPFWAFMGVTYLLRTGKSGIIPALGAAASALVVLTLSTALDYRITGSLLLPILTFAHYNMFNPLAAFYGATKWSYHLVQTIPILTFTLLYVFIDGLVAALLPPRFRPSFISHLDVPPGLRTIAHGTVFAIMVLSLSTHSEWRFLHPFLPIFLIIALPPIFKAYTPTILGAYKMLVSIRQYHRMSKKIFYIVVLTPILPLAYLSVHGRAQVEVMNVLRRGKLGDVEGLVALMPCHSTPWQSHLHRDIPSWFLTCEPPLAGVDKSLHTTQQQEFYRDPVGFLATAMPRNTSTISEPYPPLPSHVLVFGHLLLFKDGVVQHELQDRGYEEVWYGWNGLDLLQDEKERSGGVRVWRRA